MERHTVVMPHTQALRILERRSRLQRTFAYTRVCCAAAGAIACSTVRLLPTASTGGRFCA